MPLFMSLWPALLLTATVALVTTPKSPVHGAVFYSWLALLASTCAVSAYRYLRRRHAS